MQEVFIGRQAVLDRNKNVASYELLFRSAGNKFLDNEDTMTAQVLVGALMDVGLERLAGNKRVNINASEKFLLSGLIDVLPPDKVGIEVLETVPVTEEVIKACKDLKAKGYTLLLDDVVYEPRLDPLLEIVDIIKVDLPLVRDLEADVKVLRRFKGKLLAEKVETHEDYELAYALGFDYFQGYFFCKPDVLNCKTMADSKVSVLRALQQIMSTTMVSEVQNLVKQDVSLSYRLLKYINSAAFGMRREITSIEQALVLLGLNNARRWLSLLSLSSLGDDKPSELMRTALYRGYLLESIAKVRNKNQMGDDFLLGMFSVLDALLDKPMADVVSEMALPDSVQDALLRDDAKESCKLHLVKAMDHCKWDEVAKLEAHYSPLTLHELVGLNTQALAWSDAQIEAIQTA